MSSRNIPAPPPGFEIMDKTTPRSSASRPSTPPPGFVIEGAPAHPEFDGSTIPGYNPATGLVEQNTAGSSAPIAPAGDPNAFDALGYTLSQGTTFGLGDEIVAGGRTGFGLWGDYDQALAQERANLDAVKEKYPWLSLGGEIGGGVATGGGLAKGGLSLAANAAKAGKGWFTRLLAGAGEGALWAGAYGAGTGEGVRDRAERAAYAAPFGLALGAGGEALATGAGGLSRRFFRGADDIGKGVNPARNVQTAEEFGIPLSRAQATRSVPQANIENQLRSQGSMSAFDQAQREAVEQSVGRVQSRLAGEHPTIPGASASYESVPGALRQTRDALKSASRDAYEASVNNPDVLVSGEAVRTLPQFIRGKLDDAQILIDPMYHQGAARAMSYVDDYISRLSGVAKPTESGAAMLSSPAGELKSIDAQLRWIENLRAALRKNFPPVGQDAPALKAISGAIDQWTDEVFENGLVTASDDVLSQLKQARAKWSEYRSMAEPKARAAGGKLNPQYEAQRAVRNIMDKDMSPEEIGQYLWGTSVAKPKNTAFMTAHELRRLFGTDSPEWSALKQSFWLRATRAGDEVMSPAKIVKNLDGLLNGNGSSVAATLFSQAERDMMSKYLGVMRTLSPAKEGLNNSNTANRMLPALARYGSAILGSLAGAGGMAGGLGPLEAMGVGAITSGALRGVGAAAKASRASAATRSPVPVPPSGVGAGLLRGGTSAATGQGQPRKPLEITVTPPR